MSDGLFLGLATIISASVITPVVAYLIRRSERKITARVDVYHAAVNGNMEKLLKTTEELATAKQKEKGDAALKAEKGKSKREKS